jgi:hypothetical protein
MLRDAWLRGLAATLTEGIAEFSLLIGFHG